jgi:hypothetical protein
MDRAAQPAAHSVSQGSKQVGVLVAVWHFAVAIASGAGIRMTNVFCCKLPPAEWFHWRHGSSPLAWEFWVGRMGAEHRL